MAQQTINVGTSPNDGTGTPLRTAFQYTNSNFSELYTAVGPSGNNIVVPGTATITGDLTVDTSTLKVDSALNKVGIGVATLTGLSTLNVAGDIAITSDLVLKNSGGTAQGYLFGSSGINYRVIAGQPHVWQEGGSDLMRLNSTGLGVGASPVGRLNIANTGADVVTSMTAVGVQRWQFIVSNSTAAFSIYDQTNSATRLLIDTSGNVGVGVTPSYKLDINGAIAATVASGAAFRAIRSSSGDRCLMYPLAAGSGINIQSQNAAESDFTPIIFGGSTITFNYRTGVGTLATGMLLDASGNLLVGTTTTNWGTDTGIYGFASGALNITRNGGECSTMNRLTSDGQILRFYRSNALVGAVSVTTTGTTYDTSSDYRLKESVQPLSGGLARVNALKPSVYKWKIDGSTGEGFIAHELAEVVPLAVNGQKDAVNEDGSIKAQGIDMSRVVPILVAAIQELAAEVNALKNA